MAEITKPIALDESFNTTEGSPRNVADVLAQGIGDLVTVVSRISHQTVYDELSDLEDVNISTPTNGDVLTYDGSKWVNGQVGGGSTEQMIAPVETSTTASQAYAIGEQFILNGTLYTATAAITLGGTIVINGNCTASDTVANQITWKYLNQTTGNTEIDIPANATEVYARAFNGSTSFSFHFLTIENDIYVDRSGGYYATAGNYALMTWNWTKSTRKASMYSFSYAGTDVTSTTKTNWYYK